MRGLSFQYDVTQHEAVVELYIDRGDESENKAIFDNLYGNKDAIEKAFEESLDWQRLDSKRACRIQKVIQGGYRDDEQEWPDTQKAANGVASVE